MRWVPCPLGEVEVKEVLHLLQSRPLGIRHGRQRPGQVFALVPRFLVVIGEGHHLGVTDGWRMEAGKAEREARSRWERRRRLWPRDLEGACRGG
jgi:hypothetical protein